MTRSTPAEAGAEGRGPGGNSLTIVDGRYDNQIASRVLTTAQLGQIPPPSWLIDGLVPADAMTLIYGEPGAGKSLIAKSMALSMSTGVDFLGHHATHARPLYVVAEGLAGIGPRVDAWHRHHGIGSDDVRWINGAVNLSELAEIADLADVVTSTQSSVVFIDTLARCTPGVEENSSKDIGLVIARLDKLRQATGCSIVIVHHGGKDRSRGARGSTALKGAIDAELEIANSQIYVTKMKDAPAEHPTAFQLETVGSSVVPTLGTESIDDLSASAAIALETLEGLCIVDGHTVSSGEWLTASSLAQRTFYNARKSLLRCQAIVQEGTGRGARYRPAMTQQMEIGG